MLKLISYISFGLAALFGVLLGIMMLQNVKKKSLKVRKQIKSCRQFYAIAAGIFLLAGIALRLAALPTADLKEFISESSPVDSYQTLLNKTDAEGAVSALPSEIFALGDDYYIRTGEGKVYGYLQITETTTDEQGQEIKNTAYQKGLIYQEAVQVTGGEDLAAVVSENGELKLTGAFEYLTYERDDTYFRQKVYARNCTYADATDNTLFYVDGGDLYSVGYNAFGNLGDGTVRNRLTASKILENVASVSSSETHTLAVDIYGNLYGFGDNSYSEMGNRTTAKSTTPEKLMTGVKQAEAGRYFSIVLTKNGEVYAAGRNDKGQLGTGDNRDYATYMKILDGVSKIAVCKNTCAALTANGTLYVWGDNSAQQLGAGEAAITKPKQMADAVYDVAVGESSLGIISLDRDVQMTGSARAEANNEYIQPVWQFNATVPDSALYRETVEMPVRTE